MYQATRLPSGLLILSEHVPTVETVSVGVYVHTGARAEDARNNGVSHLLEHMAFKGTERRSAMDIVAEIEDVGGHMNAYTSYETTAYYLKLLREDLPLGVDILGDIMTASTFPEEEVVREKDVVLQELAQANDAPDDLVFELAQQGLWGAAQPMGRSILGTTESVQGLGRADLQQYMQDHYYAANMVLAAAGNVDHAQLVAAAEQAFAQLPSGQPLTYAAAHYAGGRLAVTRPQEQEHLVLAYGGLPSGDADIYAGHVWTTLLGGGMSSRLFQEIRERRGLVYSIYSFLSSYEDTGMFGVYAGTSPERVDELMPALHDVIAASTKGVAEAEIARAKAQLKAGLLMGLESTNSRLGRLVSNQRIYGRYVDIHETIAAIDNVTTADLARVAKRLTDPATATLVGVGPTEAATLADYAVVA